MELLEHIRQTLIIIGVAKNEAVHSAANQIGHPSTCGSNDGQATRHGFRYGQANSIFAAWADVEISGRIEIENIIARAFKTAALRNAECLCNFGERAGGIISRGDREKWKAWKRAHGTKNDLKPFDAPIVANQEQHEISFVNRASPPCFGTKGQPRGR